MSKRKAIDTVFWVALLWVFIPLQAKAYLDPATGNFVVQILVGSLLGAAFAIKSFWNVLKLKFTQLFSKQS
jgi:hypothetical protein